MKERINLTLSIAFFIILGFFGIYLTFFHSDFNFKSTEITINQNTITENLVFTPNKDYHTLYRDFSDKILTSQQINQNFIRISNVKCSSGIPYYKDFYGTLVLFDSNQKSMPYTQNNEYGCTFGENYGFKKGQDYFITSTYILNPLNLVKINDQTYIKFVVYSNNRHKLLIKGLNLKISGDNIKYPSIVFPYQQLIIYIPYIKQEKSTISQNNFKFDANYLQLLIIFLFFIPAFLVYIIYKKFGKEKYDENYPDIMSFYPNERKPYQVNAYFNLPFKELDKNFISTMLIDFYNNKIIDIKTINDKTYIKILPHKKKLDEVESSFIEFLNELKNNTDTKEDYFSIETKSRIANINLIKKFNEIRKIIDKESKKFVDKTGIIYISVIFIIFNILMAVFLPYFQPTTFFVFFLILFTIIYISLEARTTLFTIFKEDYFKEFQHWQGFKKYLSDSQAMKKTPPKGVVLWEKYLVYATALGVGTKVLKELKTRKLIDPNKVNIYSNIYMGSAAYYSSFSSATGSGGGFGGGGFSGGGMGGGGGGGR